jgi:hypothetical protein
VGRGNRPCEHPHPDGEQRLTSPQRLPVRPSLDTRDGCRSQSDMVRCDQPPRPRGQNPGAEESGHHRVGGEGAASRIDIPQEGHTLSLRIQNSGKTKLDENLQMIPKSCGTPLGLRGRPSASHGTAGGPELNNRSPERIGTDRMHRPETHRGLRESVTVISQSSGRLQRKPVGLSRNRSTGTVRLANSTDISRRDPCHDREA